MKLLDAASGRWICEACDTWHQREGDGYMEGTSYQVVGLGVRTRTRISGT